MGGTIVFIYRTRSRGVQGITWIHQFQNRWNLYPQYSKRLWLNNKSIGQTEIKTWYVELRTIYLIL
jgi:hypothetical protein